MLAANLAVNLSGKEVIFLRGDLGAGKTSFTKFLLKKLGVKLNVLSPTFNLALNYQTNIGEAYHFDLYRIKSVEELEEIGLFEVIGNNLLIIEWPEIAMSDLEKADIEIFFSIEAENRSISIIAKEEKFCNFVNEIK